MATKRKQKQASFFDYFRFGESYTSLILGILAVVIVTALLLGFVRNRNVGNRNVSQTDGVQSLTKISQTDTETVMEPVTKSPTPTATPSPKPTVKPTSTPKPTVPAKPKAQATKALRATTAPVATKKVVAKKSVTPTPKPTAIPQINAGMRNLQGHTYSIRAGDTLWNIAEKTYGSGYNWVDIARANKLSNPNNVKVGQKLAVPIADQKNATSEPEWTGLNSNPSLNVPQANKIVGPQYIVKEGDTLWNISVRAYGDGYKWTEISNENKLANPNLIFPGTTLKLPRK